MHYIVFDLEFNQDAESLQNFEHAATRFPFEIIQIGAVKLDEHFNLVSTFNHYIKPTFYKRLSPFIAELTQITPEQLEEGDLFPLVYETYLQFIGEEEITWVVWGMSDMKELFRNVFYHHLDQAPLPKHFINIQPYTSTYFNLSAKKLLKLEDAITKLELPLSHAFHNALHDAYYTAEIFRKVYTPTIKPMIYDPFFKPAHPRQPKRRVNYHALIEQFEKMYDRPMTAEEQALIKLAYNMGKTQQFLH
ncbi:exonuclease domain-containing protein [Niameybacter massiliensis]|uniref:Exonuclease domain-containing protein n=1 Tax=Holtiella tumoricola TaxID=3018743 RepID=A0AA42J0Y9_9FIRM|nr:3'-5' exonuclease [Holtiella tumoricola]MDA3731748.1 exonuclease domain-containing protein [Holtiella tumoricola]